MLREPNRPGVRVRFSDEVADALFEHRPVVALESTLISHGLPFPENLALAQKLQETVRKAGATPATVAVIDGELRAGLSASDLECLATTPGVRKVSRRDLAIAVLKRELGATTVATTMWIAHRAGIRVFSTGGIGGVHRGAGGDVSADLPELAGTPVAVVCAGAKAILDLALTLEWLETYGVPVVGYGTDEFPAFYTRSSGLPVDLRADSAAEVAHLIATQQQLGLTSGTLVCVPVPAGAEAPTALIEGAIQQALDEAKTQGVRGKAITPFMLSRVSVLTGRASLTANLALLENNAVVAAHIAVALRSYLV